MIVEKLKLKNYRNYNELDISFDKGIHLIVGKNGQGKTNLLEALYFLSTMKSHRISDDKKLINYDSDYLKIEATIKNEYREKLRVIVNEKGKNLFVYDTLIKKVSEFIGKLNAVLFCPDDMKLFTDSPRSRRRFIDIELGKLSKTYTNTLLNYNRLLKERNVYLKQNKIDENLLNTFDEQLVEYQLIIIRQRAKFLEDIFNRGNVFYKKISSEDNSILSYRYNSFVDFDDDKIMKDKMLNKYRKAREKDIYLKQTTQGIHKDDFIFYLNDIPVNEVASQGQKRSIILSIKIGIIYTIYDVTKSYPIVLLDDVFSELDKNRRIKLLQLLDDNMQIFITTNDLIKINSSKVINYYEINNGNMKKLEVI